MTKLPIVLALLVALVLPVAAEAISDGCLPPSLPTIPKPPIFADNVTWGFGSPSDLVRLEMWRESCLDNSGDVLLIRASPTIARPGALLRQQFGRSSNGGNSSILSRRGPAEPESGYCNGIYIPKTFALDVAPSGGVPFNESEAFRLVGVGGPESFQIAVPAAGPTPPPASPWRPSAAGPVTRATRSASS